MHVYHRCLREADIILLIYSFAVTKQETAIRILSLQLQEFMIFKNVNICANIGSVLIIFCSQFTLLFIDY